MTDRILRIIAHQKDDHVKLDIMTVDGPKSESIFISLKNADEASLALALVTGKFLIEKDSTSINETIDSINPTRYYS